MTAAAGGRDLSRKRKNRAIMGLLVGVAVYIVLVLTSPMLSSLWPLSSSCKPRASTTATENTEDESTLITSTNLRRGQTIYEILVSAGITYEKTNGLIREFETLFNPRKAKYGDIVKLKIGPDERLFFEYFPNSLEYYVVEELESGRFQVRKETVPQRKAIMGAKTTVHSSVYESMRSIGLGRELINRYADIFAWEVDFFTDPRKGDTIRLVWERYLSPEDNILFEGRILAAEYVNQGKDHVAILSRDDSGHFDYYSLDGKSLRRSFLRSPLNYTRISSYFSWRRFHPILKTYRPHLGIDYAAPRGTPVSAVADGKVVYSGWKGNYGKYIKIRHAQNYTTTYGHLSRIGKGIGTRKEVKQGEIIGYVGSTGLSTGPHLDFRITRNGRYVNFVKMDFPRAEPVDPKYSKQFERTKKEYTTCLKKLKESKENLMRFPDKRQARRKYWFIPFPLDRIIR